MVSGIVVMRQGQNALEEQYVTEPKGDHNRNMADFPSWVRPISWVLAPTWGMQAIRESVSGGTPMPDLLVCLGLGLLYTTIGVLVVDRFLKAARARAALSLT